MILSFLNTFHSAPFTSLTPTLRTPIKVKRLGFYCSLFTVYCLLISSAFAATNSPITIAYFNEPGCAECEQIRTRVLPQLDQRFPGQCRIEDRDVGVMSNYLELVRYQDQLGIVKNEPVYMVVANTTLLSGLREIESGLINCIALHLSNHPSSQALIHNPPAALCAALRAGPQSKIKNPYCLLSTLHRSLSSVPPPLSTLHPPPSTPSDSHLLVRRFQSFTLPTVMLAGLLDGINPCAISTLVFFMSILSMSRLQANSFWRLGLWYCIASFVTYFVLGFGLLHILRQLSYFTLARQVMESLLVAALAVFAVLSFRDAWRYQQSGNPDQVLLKLPSGIQSRIHALLKNAAQPRNLVLSAIGLGVAVTLLESVCTGQVYAPTLVLVIKSRVSVAHGSAYLLAYNVMFILPLLAVLFLTWRGLRWQRLLAWSRHNVVIAKCFLGLLFLILAGLMLVL